MPPSFVPPRFAPSLALPGHGAVALCASLSGLAGSTRGNVLVAEAAHPSAEMQVRVEAEIQLAGTAGCLTMRDMKRTSGGTMLQMLTSSLRP